MAEKPFPMCPQPFYSEWGQEGNGRLGSHLRCWPAPLPDNSLVAGRLQAKWDVWRSCPVARAQVSPRIQCPGCGCLNVPTPEPCTEGRASRWDGRPGIFWGQPPKQSLTSVGGRCGERKPQVTFICNCLGSGPAPDKETALLAQSIRRPGSRM